MKAASNYELLQSGASRAAQRGPRNDEVTAVLDAVRHRASRRPRPPAATVAVNMVWLLARTTVKASARATVSLRGRSRYRRGPTLESDAGAEHGSWTTQAERSVRRAPRHQRRPERPAGASPRALVTLFSESGAR